MHSGIELKEYSSVAVRQQEDQQHCGTYVGRAFGLELPNSGRVIVRLCISNPTPGVKPGFGLIAGIAHQGLAVPLKFVELCTGEPYWRKTINDRSS